MKEIAQKTGLSIPTVHQVLNGYNVRFSAETRRKVLEAAKELDYRPNIAARGLRAKKTFLIGLQFNAVNYPLIAGFTRGFQRMCTAESYAPIFLTHESTADEATNVRVLLDRRVDGLIVNCAVGPDGASNAEAFATMRREGRPLVEVFGRFVDGAPRVTVDYEAGAVAATRQLIAKGHKRIALFTHADYRQGERGTGLFWTAAEHWHGYAKAMTEAGLDELVVPYKLRKDRPREGGTYFAAYEHAEALFGHAKKPTAVVCYRGSAAEALLQYSNAHPTKIPGGFGLAVFDRVRPVVTQTIDLNVLPLPNEEVGQGAARLLMDLIAGREVESLSMGPRATPGSVPAAAAAVGEPAANGAAAPAVAVAAAV
ncbi:MAG: ccpA 1, partial [Phycisphaerales bacterium]|nr:ccpA 1 [Phycisphaerales bacterium]